MIFFKKYRLRKKYSKKLDEYSSILTKECERLNLPASIMSTGHSIKDQRIEISIFMELTKKLRKHLEGTFKNDDLVNHSFINGSSDRFTAITLDDLSIDKNNKNKDLNKIYEKNFKNFLSKFALFMEILAHMA